MKKTLFFLQVYHYCLFFSCMKTPNTKQDKSIRCERYRNVATQQIGRQVEIIEDSGKFLNPRTVYNSVIEYIPADDWTSGFSRNNVVYVRAYQR